MSNKYGRKILDKSMNAAKDFAKIAGKKVLTKSAEATGDLIGNKIADRITKSSINKAQKEDDRIMEETQELIIPPERSGFTREIEWNKYRSQMSTEAINNNLNILIDPTFTNVNRLFVLAYQTADDRHSYSQFYLPKIMVKDFNVIIDKLAFFDLPIKNEEEAYEKIIGISRNNE